MKANPGYVFAMACTLALAGCNSSSDCACGTDAHPTPKVISATPSGGAAPVSTTSDITIYFNETIDPASIQPATVQLTGGSADPLTITASGNRITIHPSKPLDYKTTYTASVSTDIKDMLGNRMKSVFSYSFITKLPPGFLPYATAVTGSWPEAVAIGDVNGDGRNDVIMTTSFYSDPASDYTLFVFLQNADGTLAPPVKYVTAGSYTCPPASVAIGDISGDGKNDIVVGEGNCGIEPFVQQADGTLASSGLMASVNAHQIAIGDVNNDGKPDVVGTGWATNTVSVWTQMAGGGLNAATDYALTHDGYEAIAVGDINGDHLNDIVVTSGQGDDTHSVSLLTQSAGGGFNAPTYLSTHNATSSAYNFANGVAIGDVNNDGLMDIVVTLNYNVGVFPQQADGSLGALTLYPSGGLTEPVRIADVDNDGRNDVVVVYQGTIGLLRQQADGTLGAEEAFPSGYASHTNPQGIAVGDFNGDGFADIAFANYNDGLDTLMNEGP